MPCFLKNYLCTYSYTTLILTRYLFFIVLCCSSIGFQLFGQHGKPFVSNYPPLSYSSNVYPSSPQNWSVVKDVSGKIIVANNSGLLVYDGVEWKMIQGTENKLIGNLAKDDHGKIYVGGNEEIGYIKVNDKGQYVYTSLKDKLNEHDRDFGHIKDVVVFKGEVYFVSASHLFRYSNGIFKSWKPEDKFEKLVNSSAGVFVSEKNKWCQIDGDSLHTIATLNSRAEGLPKLRGIFRGPSDTLLVVTRSQGLFHLCDEKLVPLSTKMENMTVWAACELPEDKIAIGTSSKGLFVLDSKGTVLNVFDESTGLTGNRVHFTLYSPSEFWVCLEQGISKIEFQNNVSYLNKESGLKGYPRTIVGYNNRLFVGSNEGALWLDRSKSKSVSNFTPFEDELVEGYDAIRVEDKLVISSSDGLLVLNENKRYKVEGSKGKLWVDLIKSEKNKGLIYATSYSEIIPVHVKEEGKSIIHKAAILPYYAISIAETKNGNLWVAGDKISYIDYSKGLDNPLVTTFDKQNGIKDEMGFIEVKNINEKIIFGTGLGVYVFDDTKKKLIKDTMFGEEFCDGSHAAYNLTEMRNGDVWVKTGFQTGILRKQNNNTFIYDSLPIIRAPVSDVWDVYEDDDNIVWICGTEAVIRYDPKVNFNYNVPYKAFVRGVIINDKNKIFAGNYSNADGNPSVKQPTSSIPTLEYTQNNITFQYGAAYFSTDQKLDYSIKLEGKDLKWSSWRKATEINYTNLPCGKYTFKVRSRNVYGNISVEASYSFVILPPFWETWWFILLEILFGLGLVYGLVYLRLRFVRRKHIEAQKNMQLRQEALSQQMNPHFYFQRIRLSSE